MKCIVICSVILMLFFSASAEIKNIDKPAKGKFDINLTKVWEVDSAGDDFLASVRGINVTDDGTVYVHDDKNLRFYIFSADGKFKGAFGSRGEGPGEVRNMLQSRLYSAGNKIVARDNGRLHYFEADGKYIESVIINNKKIRSFSWTKMNSSQPLYFSRMPSMKNRKLSVSIPKQRRKKLLPGLPPGTKSPSTPGRRQQG